MKIVATTSLPAVDRPNAARSCPFQFRKVLKEKIKDEAFVYLKSQKMKQEKIKNIKYKKL